MEQIKYKSGYAYQLAEDYSINTGIFPPASVCDEFICLNRAGVLLLKKGYAWDGASGIAIDTPSFMRGSLVHDALYQLIGAGKIAARWREDADSLLARLCTEDGMCTVRAWYVLRAVRAFGGSYASETRPIITAP